MLSKIMYITKPVSFILLPDLSRLKSELWIKHKLHDIVLQSSNLIINAVETMRIIKFACVTTQKCYNLKNSLIVCNWYRGFTVSRFAKKVKLEFIISLFSYKINFSSLEEEILHFLQNELTTCTNVFDGIVKK